MSIRVTCPNGHSLKVKDRFAGKEGLCPICKARIVIPVPEQEDVLGEDDIMGILDPQESGLSGLSLDIHDKEQGDQWPAEEGPTGAVKLCSKCFQEIPAESHICPECNTYIATLTDI